MPKCEWCGKEIEFKPYMKKRGRTTRFCSNACANRAVWASGNRKKPEYIDKNRPLTPDTVYLVKLWTKQGNSPKEIAYILNRPVSTINAILRGELK